MILMKKIPWKNFRRAGRLPVSVLALLCVTAILLSGCSFSGTDAGNGSSTVYTLTDIAMGTTVSATVYADTSAGDDSDDICDDIMQVLTHLENDILSWRVSDSEVCQINAAASAKESDDASEDVSDTGSASDLTSYEITLSDELAAYLAEILDVSEKSGGALDPTIGPLTQLWDIGGTGQRIPSEQEIAGLLPFVGYERLALDGTVLTVAEGTTLDLGAVGKGIGCDSVRELLADSDSVISAVVSVGGSILTYGTKPDGENWSVAIRDPRDESGYLGILSVSGTCSVSTSGDYEKYFIEDGVRYHHILDPSTGYPADSGLISVTVVCDSGLLSDALSTACFVLGYEDSLSLLSSYGAEAVFVDEEKNVFVTDGLSGTFSLSADGYTLSEG